MADQDEFLRLFSDFLKKPKPSSSAIKKLTTLFLENPEFEDALDSVFEPSLNCLYLLDSISRSRPLKHLQKYFCLFRLEVPKEKMVKVLDIWKHKKLYSEEVLQELYSISKSTKPIYPEDLKAKYANKDSKSRSASPVLDAKNHKHGGEAGSSAQPIAFSDNLAAGQVSDALPRSATPVQMPGIASNLISTANSPSPATPMQTTPAQTTPMQTTSAPLKSSSHKPVPEAVKVSTKFTPGALLNSLISGGQTPQATSLDLPSLHKEARDPLQFDYDDDEEEFVPKRQKMSGQSN